MRDAGTSYGTVIGRNISAARGRLQITQRASAERMRALGFGWKQQTVTAAEKGRRGVTAEEILGLAVALETSVSRLMSPGDGDGIIRLPGGQRIAPFTIARMVREDNHSAPWAGFRLDASKESR
jgi:transcriptional regulator with XRE-family HTH domain